MSATVWSSDCEALVRDRDIARRIASLSVTGPLRNVSFGELPGLRKLILEKPDTLDGLAKAPHLHSLAVSGGGSGDLRALSGLRALRRLWLSEMRGLKTLTGIERTPLTSLTLQYLPHLESLSVLGDLSDLRELELVSLPRVGDIEDGVGACRNLQRLLIYKVPPVRSLDFLTRLPLIEDLSLDGGRGGISLSAAPMSQLKRLRSLVIGHLGIEQAHLLGKATGLESLHFRQCGTLESLEFLRHLVDLRHFGLDGTTVADHQLGVLLELPNLVRLHRLSPQKRGYSHDGTEIDAILLARHPGREELPARRTY